MASKSNTAMLVTLFSIVVIDLIGFGIVIPVLPFYAESYGANATVLGALLTSYAAMQFLFAPIWGKLSDRFGRRPVMLITILGSSGALLILGFADSLFWLFVARILGGAFGANISVATAYVTDLTNQDNRTKWMGMIGAAFGIGFILGPAMGGLLSPYGYGVPMIVASALAAINFIYAAIVLKEPPRHKSKARQVSKREELANPFVRRMCLINFGFTIAVTQLEAVFAFFMMDQFSYDAREVAYILVAMALVMALIQGGAIRRLAEIFGEKNLLMIGVFLMAGAFSAVPWMGRVSILLIPLLVAAIGRAMAQPSMLSLVSSATKANNRGSIMGLFQSSSSLGRVLGPTIAGVLYDQFFGTPFLCGAAFMLIVLAIVSGLHVRSPHHVTLEEAEIAMEEGSTQL